MQFTSFIIAIMAAADISTPVTPAALTTLPAGPEDSPIHADWCLDCKGGKMLCCDGQNCYAYNC
jgi:hypothetical protein